MSFSFEQLTTSQASELLSLNYDLSGCVVNCSNNGMCQFVTSKFICLCDSSYLTGSACEIDTRPCSSNLCLNNGTCVDYSNANRFNMSSTIGNNSTAFYCLCDEYHEGLNCEIKKNICQNETCSSNGNCVDLENKAKCECFRMYSGDRCEIQSVEMQTLKVIITTASIIAFISLILLFCLMFSLDITKCLTKSRKGNNTKSRKRNIKNVLKYQKKINTKKA